MWIKGTGMNAAYANDHEMVSEVPAPKKKRSANKAARSSAGDTVMVARQYALNAFVRRVLPLRLLAVGIVVAAAFAVLALYRGYDRIGAGVTESAQNEVAIIAARVRQLMEEPGRQLELPAVVQQALAEKRAQPVERSQGRFAYARFYDPDGRLLAEQTQVIDAESTVLTDRIRTSQPSFPATNEHALERAGMLGRPFLRLTVPVVGRTGATVAWADGLFWLSDTAVAQVRSDALKTALYVAMIVLATTALLYPVVLTLVRRVVRYSEDLLAANLDTLEALGSAIAKRDSDTDAHNYRVTLYSLQLADAAGLDAERVRTLIKGAFLHDVGKIGIRDHILHKPAKLDADEFKIMKTHVDHGLDIVRRSRWLTDAQAVVGGHHEKYDGSGYPQGIPGESIPIEARIFAIADVFDALTSRRPYKQPLSFEETMNILDAGRGTHFDPDLLDRFRAVARELYQRYSGRDDDKLRTELRAVVDRYFVGGVETLRY
jgi:HD-GYP domain-containing protein (c-di-GMP phosphodiesterase class II)